MAKIDTSKIEGYEGMSAEEKISALEGYEYNDYSDDIQRYKNAVTKASAEASEWKKKHNALLSEEEQKKIAAEEETASIRKQLEELKKEKTVATYTANFASIGYDAELAKKTAEALADGDMSTVFATQKAFLDAKEKQILADKTKDFPTPPVSGQKDLNYDEMSDEEYFKAKFGK